METLVEVQGRVENKYSPRWWAWKLFVRSGQRIPVELELAALGCGVVIVETDLGDAAGFWDRDNGVIYINERAPITRQRFTAAHELGHKIMGHKPTPAGKFGLYQERNANIFAAELLMPAPAAAIIWARVQDLERKLEGIPLLDLGSDWKLQSFAAKFKVSKLAARIRLKCLGLGVK